jgi:ribonuclease P protein component
VYNRGQKRVGRAFVSFVARREGQGRKFGVVVPRRVGNAVTRNRIKRLVREVYRSHRAELDEDAHLIVVARQPAASLDYAACRKAVRSLWYEGEVLRG